MPFRYLLFNRRNGAPRQPPDFVPPTLDSVQAFSLETEFPVYKWTDDESQHAHVPSLQQTTGSQSSKRAFSENAWSNENSAPIQALAQASIIQPYQNGFWGGYRNDAHFYQTSHIGSFDMMETDLSSLSHGSAASSVSSHSSIDLSFSGDDVNAAMSNSRRHSTTSVSDVDPSVNSLCPLLTGQVGSCEPSLCGPNAPCLNFNGIVPPIEECVTVPKDEDLEQEFDGSAKSQSKSSQDITVSFQTDQTRATSQTPQLSEQVIERPRRTSTRTRRPVIRQPSAKDATSVDPKAMKKSKARQAHSLVERKYRENLNAKIQELHERLQSTSLCQHARRRSSASRSDESDPETEMATEELKRNMKAKKSDVLVEAMDYVEASEAEMRQMRSELKQLQDKVNILENMIMRHDCNMPATAPGNVFTFE